MPPEIHNILSDLPPAMPDEQVDTIAESGAVRIERITSLGQSTPHDSWFDQERDEWVLLLTGSAELLFEGTTTARRLTAGDYALIPAGCRHRVTWTDPLEKTVWLAVHFTAEGRP